jgi:DivIVA domain-containing protein
MAADPELSPEAVAAHVFGFARRGYEVREVQTFLRQVADQLRQANADRREFERRLTEAEERVERFATLDESRVAEILGAETTRILEAARSAADGIRQRAEEEAAAVLASAVADAEAMRAEAAGVLAERQADADLIVADQLAEGTAALERARAEADELVVRGAEAAAAEQEAGRQRGRDMVAEAQSVRDRMLRDLTRRRRMLRLQIEQLQAGRDAILAAYDSVREAYEIATHDLDNVLERAQEAARRVEGRTSTADDGTIEAEVLEAVGPVEIDPAPVTETITVPERQGVFDAAESMDAGDVDVRAEAAQGAVGTSGISGAVDPEGGAATDGDETVELPEPVWANDVVDDDAAEAPAAIDDDPGTDDVDGPGAGNDSGPDDVDDPDEDAKASPEALFARLREQSEAAAGRDAPGSSVPAESAATGQDNDGDESTDGDVSASDEVPDDQTSATPDEVRAAGGDSAGDPVAAAIDAEVNGPSETGAEAAEAVPGVADVLILRRGSAVVEHAPALTRKLKRCMADEQNEVLDVLRRTKGVPSLELVLPDAEAHRRTYADAAMPALTGACGAGAEALAEVRPEVGRRPRPGVADLADELATDVVSVLRRILDRHVSALGSNGDFDADDMAEALRTGYREVRAAGLDDMAEKSVVAAWDRAVLVPADGD